VPIKLQHQQILPHSWKVCIALIMLFKNQISDNKSSCDIGYKSVLDLFGTV
jgi:hypothetical protein